MTPWDGPGDSQVSLLRSVAAYDYNTCRAGQKVSKSVSASGLALWFAVCWDGRVLLTSSSGRQVKKVLWMEIRILAAQANRIGKIRIPIVPLDPGTGIEFRPGVDIMGFSTDAPTNLGGFSGPRLMLIADEACGIEDPIFDAIMGNMAGGSKDDERAIAKVLLIANPTAVGGFFYRSFHEERSAWHTHHIPATASPNIREGRVVIPGLATQHFLDTRRMMWGGPGHPVWDARVDGNFPTGGSDLVIPLSLVDAAQKRHDETEASGPLQIGCDPARFGDDETVAIARRGNKIVALEAVHGFDEPAVAGIVVQLAREHSAPHERVTVAIDASNGIGVGIASLLRHQRHERFALQVFESRAGDPSDTPDEYPNMRSQLWFSTKRWLQDGGALPDDEKLAGDLVAPKYGPDVRGRLQVERKKDFKKRLGRSPDRADALALAIYSPPTLAASTITTSSVAGFRFGGRRGF